MSEAETIKNSFKSVTDCYSRKLIFIVSGSGKVSVATLMFRLPPPSSLPLSLRLFSSSVLPARLLARCFSWAESRALFFSPILVLLKQISWLSIICAGLGRVFGQLSSGELISGCFTVLHESRNILHWHLALLAFNRSRMPIRIISPISKFEILHKRVIKLFPRLASSFREGEKTNKSFPSRIPGKKLKISTRITKVFKLSHLLSVYIG